MTDHAAAGVTAAAAADARLVLGVRRFGRASLPTRVLAWYIVLLAIALAGSTLLVRQVLLTRVDAQIDGRIAQHVADLRGLAEGGVDPETGEAWTSVARIFEVFLATRAPAADEMLLTFPDDGQALFTPPQPAAALHTDTALRERWREVTEPTWGRSDSAAGPVRYAAVPVVTAESRGVVVVATFVEPFSRDIEETIRVVAVVGFAALLAASLLAWTAVGRVLAPVRLVTDAARTISETDLSRRIPVRGSDEISRLAATFNQMLDRLQTAFATQRAFVDDAGHELRTPITIIRGHLELLDDDPAERQETVALVTDELERMTRMVDDLLTLAKAEQPDFLHRVEVDVAELTADLAAKASALAPRRWLVDAQASGIVVADRQRLTQAVLQLATNAVQHTAEGATIALGSALDHHTLRLWVRDDGPGVPAAERERIFERFARATGTRRRSEGAGLGLSIVQAISEAQGGTVRVDDAEGGGALFTITVPATDPSDH